MIQILKQRSYTNKKGERTKGAYKFVEPKIEIDTVQELFLNLEDYIAEIPSEERYNLHYTLATNLEGEKPRQFQSQNIIPFDIDGIDVDRIDEYLEPCLQAIGNLNMSDVAIVGSGRGLHFLVGSTFTITDSQYFKDTKRFYNAVCDRINLTLKRLSLQGEADPGLWSANHCLRLPGTLNIKNPQEGYKNENFSGNCEIIYRVINPIPNLEIKDLAGQGQFKDEQYLKIQPTHRGGSYPVDNGGVMDCPFMQWASKEQTEVSETQWWSMISIASYMEESDKLIHEFSENHPDYDPEETEAKRSNCLAFGPHTCQTISEKWSGCQQCPHYGKITSPISIKSKNYIKTKATGFREVKQEKVGIDPATGQEIFREVPGRPNYEDLRKYFEQKHEYISTFEESIYVWNETHWKKVTKKYVEGFAQRHIVPPPTQPQRTEFLSLVKCTNLKEEKWFDNSTFQKMNLQNGVLDLSGKEPKFIERSTKYGFRTCLNYDYDPDAQCPTFDQFMIDVTKDRKDLENILLEFAGYSFANDECRHAKALILLGEGSNGKSTFIELLQEIAGEGSYSSLSARDLEDPQHRAQMEGKLFNLSEETPNKSFVDSSVFKNVVSGGAMTVKIVYQPPYSVPNRAKLIMAANELPRTGDLTHGFLRRLLIIPFDNQFKGTNRDKGIKHKMYKEIPGILNRILEGYRRLCENDEFTQSETVIEALTEFRQDNDPIFSFVSECLVIKPDWEMSDEGTDFSDIYQAFQNYQQMRGSRLNIDSPRLSRRINPLVKDFKWRKKRKGKFGTTKLMGVFLVEEDRDF